MLKLLQEKNPQLHIASIDDPSFKRYGQILNISDFSEVLEYLENQTEIPKINNFYLAHDPHMQASIKHTGAIQNVFGNMPVEYGYVNGHNTKLNALEYHKSSEINVYLTPVVLMFARVEDLHNHTLETNKVAAFFIPENTAIEIFSQTLHFSPCKVNDHGFKCGVLLPFGTNMEFIPQKVIYNKEDHLLFKTNKWIIVHPEHRPFVELGATVGLIGPNIEIKY
ncbi:MAG: DUF4867 family protein [Bacillota bacterium]|nr:MAG: DUF4867 family protein [Bacillota bacterium]